MYVRGFKFRNNKSCWEFHRRVDVTILLLYGKCFASTVIMDMLWLSGTARKNITKDSNNNQRMSALSCATYVLDLLLLIDH